MAKDLTPNDYPSTKPNKYGKYLVIRKDGKTHLEIYNGTGWAYNNKEIVIWYSPDIDSLT